MVQSRLLGKGRHPTQPREDKKNPGRRSRAKMMLNSFWGKYGQQGNKSQVKAISSPDRLYNLLNNDSQELQTLLVMNDEMIEVVYSASQHQHLCGLFHLLLSQIQTQERLSQLHPEQVLYFDTDSFIFSQRPGDPTLPTAKIQFFFSAWLFIISLYNIKKTIKSVTYHLRGFHTNE